MMNELPYVFEAYIEKYGVDVLVEELELTTEQVADVLNIAVEKGMINDECVKRFLGEDTNE